MKRIVFIALASVVIFSASYASYFFVHSNSENQTSDDELLKFCETKFDSLHYKLDSLNNCIKSVDLSNLKKAVKKIDSLIIEKKIILGQVNLLQQLVESKLTTDERILINSK